MYPDGYKPETNEQGAYLKLKEGDTRIRILSAPIIGYVGWTNESKPIRCKAGDKMDISLLRENTVPKEFHAFIIWNYRESRLEIAEFTQASIKNDIFNLAMSDDWGDARKYDIVIKRKGTGFNDTEYSIMPSPAKELDEAIKTEFLDSKIDLTRLYSGENPFGGNNTQEQPKNVTTSQNEPQTGFKRQFTPSQYSNNTWTAEDDKKIENITF